jgi:hypothetical protein
VENQCDPTLFEFPTLDMLREFSRKNPGWKILYVHTKGISTPENQCVADWRKSMLHYTVAGHDSCIKLLEKYDTIGCNLREYCGFKHWQGNFWWATSDYIARLGHAEDIVFPEEALKQWQPRHKAEAWIFTGNPKAFQIYDHKINPYSERNPDCHDA